MASTLPNGTVAAGTAKTPTDPTDITTVQPAVKDFLTSLAGVEIRTDGADYLVFGPTTGTGTYVMLFSATKIFHADQRFSALVLQEAGHVSLAYIEDDYDDVDASWYAGWLAVGSTSNPIFGAGTAAKCSGFVAVTGVVTADNVASVYGGALTADSLGVEIVNIMFEESASSRFGFFAGSVIAQANDTIADGTFNRIPSITTTQGVYLSSNCFSDKQYFPGASETADNCLTIAKRGASWVTVHRVQEKIDERTADYGKATTGEKFSAPILVTTGANGWLGWLRNMRVHPRAPDGEPVDDLNANLIGYVLSYGTGVSFDAFCFRSGAP